MDKIKKIIPIIVILLLLSISLTPATVADAPAQKKKLTIIVNGVTEDDYKYEAYATQNQINTFTNKLNGFFEIVNSTIDVESPYGEHISDDEWHVIESGIRTLIDYIAFVTGDDFPKTAVYNFLAYLIYQLLTARIFLRQPVISVGIGLAWIPFYEYETSVGKIFKPIFIQHLFGFSATAKLNPFVVGFPCWSHGFHRIRTFFFEGLFINFGDLGFNRLVGPQVLLGFGYFTGMTH